MKIYTKTGDSGETSLFDGTRVSKADSRVSTYGEVDELNAFVGLARALLAEGPPEGGPHRGTRQGPPEDGPYRDTTDVSRIAEMLEQIQRDLFALGSRLADPSHKVAERVTKAAITAADITRLEGWIDQLETDLPPLRRFILPGGSPAGAALHVARTVCRRAERAMVTLEDLDRDLLVYVNRLSDLLFVMARAANRRADTPEVEW